MRKAILFLAFFVLLCSVTFTVSASTQDYLFTTDDFEINLPNGFHYFTKDNHIVPEDYSGYLSQFSLDNASFYDGSPIVLVAESFDREVVFHLSVYDVDDPLQVSYDNKISIVDVSNDYFSFTPDDYGNDEVTRPISFSINIHPQTFFVSYKEVDKNHPDDAYAGACATVNFLRPISLYLWGPASLGDDLDRLHTALIDFFQCIHFY